MSQQAGVRDGEVTRGLTALLTEVERVDRHGFTASELERIKTNIRRSYEQAYRERDKVRSSSLAAEYGRNFLEGEPIPGIEAELDLVERFLPTVELEEVNRLARDWITDENRVIMVTGPEREEVPLPGEEEIMAVFDAVAELDVEPFVDQVRDAPLVSEVPPPGEIVERSAIDEIGVTEWRLSNGIRVVMKPTDFKNDQVLISGWSPGGHSLVSDEHHTSALFATSILGESGLGEFSQIELGKALAGKVAGVGPFISELEEGFSGSASPEDLETLFQLLYLQATAPRLDPEIFTSLMSRYEMVVKNRLSRPETVFGDRFNEVVNQDHPRRRPMTEELLAEIDPDAALEIYRERFADVGDFTFVLVGNFQPVEIQPLVVTYLGGLPAAGREETWRNVGVQPTPRAAAGPAAAAPLRAEPRPPSHDGSRRSSRWLGARPIDDPFCARRWLVARSRSAGDRSSGSAPPAPAAGRYREPFRGRRESGRHPDAEPGRRRGTAPRRLGRRDPSWRRGSRWRGNARRYGDDRPNTGWSWNQRSVSR